MNFDMVIYPYIPVLVPLAFAIGVLVWIIAKILWEEYHAAR